MSEQTIQPASYFEAEEKRLRGLKTSVIEHHLQQATKDDLERLVNNLKGELFTHPGYESTGSVEIIRISFGLFEDDVAVLTTIDSSSDNWRFPIVYLTDSDQTRLLKLIEATI
jgi:hypothetical protein